MRPWLVLFLALGSGAVAAYLALGYLRQQAVPLLAAEAPKTQVAIAARDLPVGAVIGEKDVKLVDWPGDALPPGYSSNPQEIVGRGVITPVRLNEPLLSTKLADKGAGGGLPIIISDGMRAVSVRVDEVIAVAGFVVPGTRVDVLLTLGREGETQTRAILQNMQILAAGQSVQRDPEGKPQTVTVITLLTTPDQAETLTLASQQGRIQLALRNMLDTVQIQTVGARASGLLAGGAKPAAGARRPRGVVTAPTPEARATVVEGYRGGAKTLTTFRSRSDR